MDLDRAELKKRVNESYVAQLADLGRRGAERMLDEARQWDLSELLESGGVVTFAHVNVTDCGLHVAAAVNACLDTGADTVLAIGVVHASTDEMERARQQVAAGGPPEAHKVWGIQGPGLDFRDEWSGDHSLRALRHFWEVATAARGITDRRLVERYPYLAGGRPGDLPNLDETAALAEDAVIIATGDQFHHGIAYGTSAEEAMEHDDAGLAAARESMEAGVSLIESGDYWGYNSHCVTAKSDDRDVAQLFRFLRGPLAGSVIETASSDFTRLYDQPAPSWAAGGFAQFASVG
jgi:hypothetical protein